MENISAGHLESFIIDNDKLYKQAKIQELTFYKEIDNEQNKYYKENQLFKQFCPKYYGEIVQNGKNFIMMENLFYKMPVIFFPLFLIKFKFASSIDFKLGRKTYMPDVSQKKIEGETLKAKESTGEKLGFRISGLQIKDKNGKIKKKFYRQEAYKTIKEEGLEEVCSEILKSNDFQEVNKKALEHYIQQLELIIQFFSEQNTRFFIAMSVLVLCDNISNSYCLKLIDFGHYGDLKSMEKDENVLEGLRNILTIFINIQKKI